MSWQIGDKLLGWPKIRDYVGVAPSADLLLIQKLADKLSGRRFLHVNSTKSGGGVAVILQRMMPILENLGIKARWEVIEGDPEFFEITKKIHNALQGREEKITERMWHHYYEVNRENANRIEIEAEAVLIHDPQPAPLIEFRKSGKWIWRCHIDLSNPVAEVCDRIRRYCVRYDAAIFSVEKFAQELPLDEFIIPPAIAPFSDKNRQLGGEELQAVLDKFHLSTDKPLILQVSRFDRFKDPIGVIKAYRLVKRYNDCSLVLAGSPATDDPEGEKVLNEVREFAQGDPDVHILMLPPSSDVEINALQTSATVILQKSIREGFGLTVSEAMWKGKPVVGGAAGGIPLQILHGVTGFLVHSVEGAAFRVRQLLNNPELARKMGQEGKEYVRKNFLITRQVRDYLAAFYILENKGMRVMEI